jgi:molecular chaperone IbpA
MLLKEDMAMRTTLDFAPLYRSSIGFDRMFNLLETASRVSPDDNWPPYDIVKTGEDNYQLTMAVAGFAQDELTITHQANLLVVAGQKSGDDNGQYLHRGLTGRAIERRFELADHVKVAGASLVNGLLTLDLERELPETLKPRRIEIGPALHTSAEPRQIEAGQQAANRL